MKKKIIAATLGVVAIVAIATAVITNQKPEQTATTATVEAGEKFNPKATDYFTGKHVSDVKFDTSKVDTDKVGEYKATATYKKNSWKTLQLQQSRQLQQIRFIQKISQQSKQRITLLQKTYPIQQ